KLHEPVEFTEDLGLFASFLVWAIFGALLLAPQLRGGVSPTAIIYAVLSLTLVRIVPVAVAMIGTDLRPASLLFMGWFGPRGLASVVFTLIAFESLREGGLAPDALIEVATWTVFLSVIAHGITAGPLAIRYGRRVSDEPVEQLEAGAHLGDPVPRALTDRPASQS
ncbi:MAG TPA: cation:proton antiporter, partial [Acidimicrobiia bacterium]|nr:cation:proton antiporter [Acidimicrobiia bacterium]